MLLRPASRGLMVACVHRPDRDDWSLPKGKLKRGESFEECARREVLEETGYGCALGQFAGHTEYTDRRGRPKVVAYWYMDPAPGVSFDDAPCATTDEIDEVCWMELVAAERALTYRHDRELLRSVGDEAVALFG